ncbi:class I SAM-dependent methyltransferase [Amycolatopsis sp. lyj-346]|uniref:class I SAM-dependent methyltransferase n=1 Tax=Amycolatopsis sp. lyj-346 TaxID=2789289 RepID=UPI00397D6440
MKDWEWFDRDADSYEENLPVVEGLGRALADFAGLAPGLRLLDVGSGTGAVARPALTKGCRITAIDMAPNMLRKLQTDLPEITVRRMDVTRLGLPDGSFDVVLAGWVLDILDDPAAAVTEIHRVLAPGGTFAASVKCPLEQRWYWFRDMVDELGPREYTPRPPIDVPALLAEAGFGAVERRLVEHPRRFGDPEALWNRLMSALSASNRLPAERATEFRERFLAHARRMHADGDLVVHQDSELFRAKATTT